MILKGLVFDVEGEPMSPTFTHARNGTLYRYYVSASLQQGARRQPGDDNIRRVPAGAIETLAKGCLTRLAAMTESAPWQPLVRVEIHPTTVQLTVRRSGFFKRPGDADTELGRLADRLGPGERIVHEPSDATLARVTIPCRLVFRGGRVWTTGLDGRPLSQTTKPDRHLIRALQASHGLVAHGGKAPLGRMEDLVLDQAPPDPYDRNLARLAFLAPDIQALILEGRQPSDLNLATLLHQEIPPCWDDQRRAFDIPC